MSQAVSPARAVVRPDTIRRRNLALVLEQVHRDGPLTRAELTTRLGLNRSTIGALVAELEALHLLQETVPGHGQRAGRPSHVVGPRDDGPYAVAVEVEVDRLTAAAVEVGGGLAARVITRLPISGTNPAAVSRAAGAAVRRVAAAMPSASLPVGVGVSIPGTVRADDGVVEVAPNLGWRDVPFGPLLAADLDGQVPVTIGNDADLGVLAEHVRGAARDATDVVYLTGRIGVGAGILVDGRLLRGVGGLAGEIGHTILDPDGLPCHCGGRGCVEGYIGEQALLRLAGRVGPFDAEAVGAVFAAARAGEALACRAVAQVGRSLGQVLANLVNLLNPEVVVLGGALSSVLELARTEVLAALDRQAMHGPRAMVDLRTSGLGDDSSLLGAAELSMRALMTDPVAVAGR